MRFHTLGAESRATASKADGWWRRAGAEVRGHDGAGISRRARGRGRARRLGALKQGEKVDVLATYGTGADAYTAVVLRQALVTEVDRGRSSLGDTGSSVVSVAVDDPDDELAMAHALQLGKLTVVVATGSPA